MSTKKPVHVPRNQYPEAFYPTVITPSEGEYQSEEDVHLLDYWLVIASRRWTIVSVLLTVVLAAMIYTFKQTPLYRATASVQIEKENPNVLSFKDVYQVDVGDDDTLRTQFEVLKSRRLARRVIESLKLDKTDEFRPKKPDAVDSVLKSIHDLITPQSAKDSKEPDALRPIVDLYLKRLEVTPVRQARLANISFDSEDPELAAKIINSHAEHFIKQNLQFKVEATEAASQFLQENLVTLKANLERVEDQLQQYSQKTEILFTDDGKNTASEKLRQLQEAFTKAQENRIQKESYYRLVQTGRSEALPQMIENKLIADLTARLVDLERQESDLAVTFQPEYPPRKRIASQIEQTRHAVETEKSRISTMITAEYSAAKNTEESLAMELEKQREVVNKINEDIIQYNIYKADAQSAKELYDGLQKRLKEASVSAGLTASNIRIVDTADVPEKALTPRKGLNLAISMIVGLMLGIGLAFLQEYLDNSVKSPEDVARFLHLPTLAMVPRLSSLAGKKGYAYERYAQYGQVMKAENVDPQTVGDSESVDLIVYDSPSSLMAESYRSLRTSLLLSSSGHPPKVIVVTSAAPSEGKTTTAVNLAISLTQTGSKVVLIDADMRKPRIQRVFSLDGAIGLSSFLAGTANIKDIIHETKVPGLMVVPCGMTPPNPGELILSAGFRTMLKALSEYFDFVVLDSPPVGNVSDARIIAVTAESTILVVKAFSTSRHQARDASAHLTNANARVAGVVINDVDLRKRSYYSGYSYDHSYYSAYGARVSQKQS
jgi:capsular exopolysaccharide synthesis family protein